MSHHPSADQIIDLYDRHASAWNDIRAKHFVDRKWIERFRSLLPPSSTVLDLGCGSGQPVARYLIEAGTSVVGVDSSRQMLALCAERFPAQEWIQADMRTLALDRQFTAILAWNSFFHLKPEDQRRMFPIFQRHAAPGALLMFTSGPAHGEALGVFEGETLYHASLAPQEYTEQLHDHGYEVLDHIAEDAECGGQTVWLARRLP
ncbi:class I SAM-dependent methyltransferase [Pseudomonas putida]|uniref:class I SAM-dependent methyltransferase n=1 Tax=Pseudomonas putida group TaxID=136845 RepID=UPI0010593BC3|nr:MULTISPECIES: class I SAM-dependent methyltransferase [Pseudomonas putida group]MBF8745318.1 class I SAM-dependent methyltransferase [Pseudomonas monteilii]TDJ79220.1 class I SAM-dependent methyltransferase [Pseudomonas putida]